MVGCATAGATTSASTRSAALDVPLLRDGDEWVQIAWDDAIAMWAAKIKTAIGEAGPSSVARSAADGSSTRKPGSAAHFSPLGGRISIGAPGRQRVADHGFGGTYTDLENAQVIVTYGVPPSELAPIMDLRIRKAVEHRGATLFSLGFRPARSHVPERNVAGVRRSARRLSGCARARRRRLGWARGCEQSGTTSFAANLPWAEARSAGSSPASNPTRTVPKRWGWSRAARASTRRGYSRPRSTGN